MHMSWQLLTVLCQIELAYQLGNLLISSCVLQQLVLLISGVC